MDPANPPPGDPEAIAGRRATRRFDPDRPLDDALLARVLHLATLAPSAYNLQPWRFLVVRREPNRRKLRACAFQHPILTEAPVVVIVLGYHTPDRSHLDTVVNTMQTLGALTPEAAAEWRARAVQTLARCPDRSRWATRWAMAAATTLMIASQSLGLASAPIETLDPAKLNDAFGIPDDHTVACLIALGFAAESPPFPGRLDLADVCYEEHFGQPWRGGDG